MRSLRDANLFAAAMASRRCVCCKAHLYLQIEYGQATWSALPRRYSICDKQESRAKIFAAPFGDIKNEVTDVRSLRDANLFAAAEAYGICGCRKATVYLQIDTVRQRGVLCRGATVYAASKAQTNIRRSLSDANLFAIAMASRRCVCCKATVYLQIEYSQATWSALPRRYSICGKQSADEYTQKPARCKLVCSGRGLRHLRVP